MAEKQAFTKQTKKRSPWTFIIVVLLAAVFIPATVYAVMYVIELRSEATIPKKPSEVEITNITDTSASISWVTAETETIGYAKYGIGEDLSNVAFDTRDLQTSSGKYRLHYINLSGLSPETKYDFEIYIDEKVFNDDAYTLTTGPTLEAVSTPQPMIGEVDDPTGGGEEVIIYFYVVSGNNTSNKLSTLTESKRYTLDFSNLRTSDLRLRFTNLTNAQVFLEAEGAQRGVGTVQTEIIQLD